VQLGAVTALLLPVLAWYYSRSDFQSIGMAVAGTIFLLSAIRSSKVLSRAMGQNLRLNYELMQAKADAERVPRIDELTGLFNRRALYEQLDLQVAQARRSGDPLSLVLLDVDRFKEINDRNGHRYSAAWRHCCRR
jgi:PleD family two-component response regulator